MLSAGTRLGPYEILSPIGAGGMGEVFKARDTRLDRTVAIKTSVQQFSERFDREARAIAALNHPHICQLYDVGPDYLVMEYLDGAPLRGPLPLEKVLEYARQICDALDAAHRKGITHRDLKPANILLTRTGVKLLDFGLAKMARRPVTGDETLTQALTGQNTIVGTLSYMSPEQVQGKDTDTRSDIFSFAVVLYEMLTGKRAFDGDNPASVISSIMLKEPPPVSGVAPPSLDRILQRCLKKDPEERWQNARDLMFELSAVAQPDTPPRPRGPWLVPALTALLAVAATLAISHFLPRDTPTQTSDWKLSLTPLPGSELPEIGNLGLSTPEISPDGSMVAASIGGSLFLRRLNTTGWTPLRGTEGAQYVFWSADSREIGFLKSSRWIKMSVPNGAPEVLWETHSYVRGATWSSRGQILTAAGGLWIGPAGGGSSIQVMPNFASKGPIQPNWPHFLPDGEHFIFTGYDPKAPEGPVDGRGIYLAAWRDGRWKLPPVRLKTNLNEARYSPVYGGSLLFVQSDNLYAQRLNISQARLEGEPELVVEGVGTSTAFGDSHFSLSDSGTLAWRPGKAALAQLTWFDRQGKVLEFAGPPDSWNRVELSPDQRRIAGFVQHAFIDEIRVLEVNKSTVQHLPSSPGRLVSNCCLWLPDNDHLLYTERELGGNSQGINSQGKLMQQSAEGGGIRELGPAPDHFLENLSADGKKMLVWGPEKSLQIAPFPPDGSPPLRVSATADEANGAISPDGKWVAYTAQREIFVQPLTGSALRRQISASGGYAPAWRADGGEILYLSVQDRRIWSVACNLARGEFQAAVPLFQVRLPSMVTQSNLLAVTRDGSHILFAQAVEQPESNQINIAGDASQVNKSR